MFTLKMLRVQCVDPQPHKEDGLVFSAASIPRFRFSPSVGRIAPCQRCRKRRRKMTILRAFPPKHLVWFPFSVSTFMHIVLLQLSRPSYSKFVPGDVVPQHFVVRKCEWLYPLFMFANQQELLV